MLWIYGFEELHTNLHPIIFMIIFIKDAGYLASPSSAEAAVAALGTLELWPVLHDGSPMVAQDDAKAGTRC